MHHRVVEFIPNKERIILKLTQVVCGLILLSVVPVRASMPGLATYTEANVAATGLRNVSYPDTQTQAFSEPQQTWFYGEDENQFIHFWPAQTPSINNAKAPVIFIHGGCWLSAFDINHTYPIATALAKVGHPVYNIEYRRTGETQGGWPTTFNDIQAALLKIQSLLTNSSSFVKARDARPVVNLVGHSAGGHLALLLAMQGADIWPENWQVHVFGLAAIVDIKTYAQGSNSCQKVTKDFIQGMPTERPGAYYLANPREHSLKAPQLASVTLLQGSIDTIVPREQANHKGAKTVLIHNVGHFDWLHAQSVAFLHLLTLLK